MKQKRKQQQQQNTQTETTTTATKTMRPTRNTQNRKTKTTERDNTMYCLRVSYLHKRGDRIRRVALVHGGGAKLFEHGLCHGFATLFHALRALGKYGRWSLFHLGCQPIGPTLTANSMATSVHAWFVGRLHVKGAMVRASRLQTIITITCR